MFNRLKATAYLQLFILLNLAYLLIDLSFNARLLDISLSSQLNFRFDKLELYGRAISSIGATLVAWRWLVPFHPKRSLGSYVVRFSLIFVLVFPAVFVGQKKLIDTLVDQSSAEIRRSAQQLSLLKFGLLNDFIHFDALKSEPEAWKTPEGRMLVSLAGPVLYQSARIREQLEEYLPNIAERAVETEQNQQAAELYNAYRFVRQQSLDQYRVYSQIVTEFESQRAEIIQRAAQIFEQNVQQALQTWDVYQKEQEQLLQQYQLQQEPLRQQLLEIEQIVQSCSETDCDTEELQQAWLEFGRLLGSVVEPSDWCSNPETGLHCIPDLENFASNLEFSAQHIAAIASGIDPELTSRISYLNSSGFEQRVFLNLETAGFPVNPELSLKQHIQIVEQIQHQLLAELEHQYNQRIKTLWHQEVAPRLSYEEFIRLPLVQEPLHQLFDRIEINFIPLQWDRQEFKQQLFDPAREYALQGLMRKLQAPASWHEDGGPYEQAGKNALRSLLVPPLVLSISLLVILLNLINMLFGLSFVIIKPTWPRRLLVSLILLASLIGLPFLKPSPLTEQPGFHQLVKSVDQEMPYSSYMLQWLVRTESVIYPFGNIIRFNLLNGFEFE